MTSRLPLFRILQASLSNVQRHAESPSVDIRFAITAREAKPEVKDCGKGIRLEVESDATGELMVGSSRAGRYLIEVFERGAAKSLLAVCAHMGLSRPRAYENSDSFRVLRW